MRSSYIPRGGPVLMKTPTYRQQAARRWLLAACAIVGLALASGLVGTLTAPRDSAATGITTGPFSYFPHQ